MKAPSHADTWGVVQCQVKAIQIRQMAAGRPRVFVYGTLMNGFKNFNVHLKGPKLPHTKCRVHNASLVDFTHWGFPGLVMHRGSDAKKTSVLGEAFDCSSLSEVEFNTLVANLDRLEEYYGPGDPKNQYKRLQTTAHTDSGETLPVWLYECLIPLDVKVPHTFVADGDWRAFMSKAGREGAGASWTEKKCVH